MGEPRYSIVLQKENDVTVLHDRFSDVTKAEKTFRYERLILKEKQDPNVQLQLRIGGRPQLVWPGPATTTTTTEPEELQEEEPEVEEPHQEEEEPEGPVEMKKLTGYQYFVQTKRDDAVAEIDEELTGTEKSKAVMAALGAKWKELRKEEKAQWKADAPEVPKKKPKKKKPKPAPPPKKKTKKQAIEEELSAAVFAVVKDEGRFGLMVHDRNDKNWPAIIVDPRTFYAEAPYRLVLKAPQNDLVLFLGEDTKKMYGSLRNPPLYDRSTPMDGVALRAVGIAEELAAIPDPQKRLHRALDIAGFKMKRAPTPPVEPEEVPQEPPPPRGDARFDDDLEVPISTSLFKKKKRLPKDNFDDDLLLEDEPKKKKKFKLPTKDVKLLTKAPARPPPPEITPDDDVSMGV